MSAAEVYAPASALVERLMRRVTKDDSGCWLFDGCLNSRGYGLVSAGRKGKNILTHRLVVIARDGGIPEGLTVDHMCEVRRCVNPDHLQVVTGAENTRLRFTRHLPPPPVMNGPSFDIKAFMRDLAGGAA